MHNYKKKNSETKLAANILKQDPNTQKVKKNAYFNQTTQTCAHFQGFFLFPFSSSEQLDKTFVSKW